MAFLESILVQFSALILKSIYSTRWSWWNGFIWFYTVHFLILLFTGRYTQTSGWSLRRIAWPSGRLFQCTKHTSATTSLMPYTSTKSGLECHIRSHTKSGLGCHIRSQVWTDKPAINHTQIHNRTWSDVDRNGHDVKCPSLTKSCIMHP